MTKAGVEYDLGITPYAYVMMASCFEVKLFFSSRYNMERYKKLYDEQAPKMKEYLRMLMGYGVNFELAIALKYYIKVEKRGFRALIDGGEYNCPESVEVYSGPKSRIVPLNLPWLDLIEN